MNEHPVQLGHNVSITNTLNFTSEMLAHSVDVPPEAGVRGHFH